MEDWAEKKYLPTRQVEHKQSTDTRRNFLIRGGKIIGAAVVTLLGSAAIRNISGKGTSQPTAEREIPLNVPVVAHASELVQNPKKESLTLGDVKFLNEILALPISSDERKQKEIEYFNKARNLKQIDLGLAFISYFRTKIGIDGKREFNHNWELKAQLLNRRYDLRQAGHSELKTLPQDLVLWAEQNKIHPEILALSHQALSEMESFIWEKYFKLPEGFRPDLVDAVKEGYLSADFLKKLKASDLMLTAGGLAKLIVEETGQEFPFYSRSGKKIAVKYGFINQGFTSALTQINTKQFPNAPASLREIVALTSKDLGINIIPENVVGSERVGENESGGAIGGQIMPDNALEMYKDFKESGITVNFFSPDVARAMIFFLASAKRIGNDLRFGMLRGPEQITLKTGKLVSIKELGLRKWNNSDEEVYSVMQADESYFRNFIANQKYAH